jgi:tetratricopeptide (TPR) repeat protein
LNANLLKMKNYLLPIALFGSISLVSYISPAAALSPVEVQRIAKQTTVQITGCGFGSGAIIRKNGNTYTVLTVAHSVKNTGCEVTTPDDTKYQIAQIKTFPDRVDLAVFTFTSNKNYPVAKLIDNSDRVEAQETIYVSGFPLSTAINSSVFTIVRGDVVANPPTKQQGKGYSLIYSNNTLPGHSGGPVWNDKGEVIAIHGQGDIEAKSQATINDDVRVKTGYNLGITVNTFTKLATAAGVSGYAPVLVAAKPKPVDDLIASSVLKESKGDYRGVLADMEQAISIDSQNARLYFGRGVAKSSLGDHKGAIDDYNRAIALNPNFAEAYYNRGVVKFDLGDPKGTIDDSTRAIALNPNYASAYNNRGVVKSSLGDHKGAIDDYKRAITLNSSDANAYNNRSSAKFGLGDHKGAIDDSNRAIALNPNFADAYHNRGSAKSGLRDNKGAIEDYNRAIALNPNYASAYYNRGVVKSSLGDNKGAIEDYNRAIALNPNYASAYYNRGVVKFDLGDNKGAIDDFNRAIALNPNYAEAYGNRGGVKSGLGDKQGAIQDLKKAADLFRLQGQTDKYQRAITIIKTLMPEASELPPAGF